MLKPIKNRAQHKAALKRIDQLMDATREDELAELSVLAILVEKYERETFPIDPPSALDAIRFRMEQMGYTQADLGRLLNSRSRASEIMKGKGRLSLGTIRRLHDQWRIPAEILIREAA
ncbi:MAG: helix-turn-helix domain-containing protein [Alphaproteobacteria bacterium]|nr:helix-turn-helix domain-containing protein [Alphaproteobacteria bacterium]